MDLGETLKQFLFSQNRTRLGILNSKSEIMYIFCFRI